ncbi:MAG: ferritin-like domain-containing protein [Sandaracinaceae bacterium]
MASRDQWSVGGLDWSAVDLGAVPTPLACAAATLFSHAQLGELTAMMTASRLMERLDDPTARLVCATQIHDEARHSRFFENLVVRLGEPAPPRDSIRSLMREVYEHPSTEGMMLGMQILIEGMAHSLFSEGARVFASLDQLGALTGPLLAAKTVVGEWLPLLLGRDESRHIAFGLHYLRVRVPELDRSGRHALEETVEGWAARIHHAAEDPDLLDSVGIDGSLLSACCIADLNLRLSQIGLEARFEPPA